MSQTLVENPVQVSETGGNQPPFNASGTTLPRAHLVTPLPNTNTTGPDSPTSSLVIASPVDSDDEEDATTTLAPPDGTATSATPSAPSDGTAASATSSDPLNASREISELLRILQTLIEENQKLKKSNDELKESNDELKESNADLKRWLKAERCANTRQRTIASDQSMAQEKANRTMHVEMEQMQATNAKLTKSNEHLNGIIKNLAEPLQNGRAAPPLIAGSVPMDVAMIAANYAHVAQLVRLFRRLIDDYEKKIETLSKSSGNDKSPEIGHYKAQMAKLQQSINECLSAMDAMVVNGPPRTREVVTRVMLMLPRMYNIPQQGPATALIAASVAEPAAAPVAEPAATSVAEPAATSVAKPAAAPVFKSPAASVTNSATTLFTKPAAAQASKLPAAAPVAALVAAPASNSDAMPVKRTASQAEQDTDEPATELGKRACVNDSADALGMLADVAAERQSLFDLDE